MFSILIQIRMDTIQFFTLFTHFYHKKKSTSHGREKSQLHKGQAEFWSQTATILFISHFCVVLLLSHSEMKTLCKTSERSKHFPVGMCVKR